ncbi:T9SS type A sorting domain-containing protein [Flavobacterium sp. AS60]|uniref:T9SS type A sorting domain-containing protein n=1 Tax=Flavobacterium anseongense TaxID=2910677 RepID=UPI001F458D88|nr:T9SS type A sorting domain-containing protein [Flavobacterium sp. AS60]MCF6129664.1 T9SS type A sorting domain-containing protein [Flavobacterium sp. AS60]
MKKFNLLFLFLLGLTTYAQAPIIEWQKCYGGTNDDQAQSIQRTNDGGYIVANLATSNDGDVTNFHTGTGGDIWVVKTDGNGNIEWQKALGGSNSEGTFNVKQTTDNGYLVCGYSGSYDGDVTGNHGGVYDLWIVKLNGAGNIVWQKTYGGTNTDGFWSSFEQTADDGFIVICNSSSNDGDVTENHGNSDIWVIKLNSIGDIQWQKTYGGTGYDDPRSIQLTPDGGYILCGYTESNNGDFTSNHGFSDAYVIKINSTGDILWQKTYGSQGYDRANTIIKASDGGFIFVGDTTVNGGDVSGTHGGYDIWVVKINNIGTIQWQKCLGGTGNEGVGRNCIVQLANDDYAIVGITTSTNGDVTANHGGQDSWLLRLSNTGSILWQKTYGGSSNDCAYSLCATPDDGYIMAGLTASFDGDVSGNHGYNDYWVVKVGPDSLATSDYDLFDPVLFPNPVSNQLNIISETSNIKTYIIYDTLGKTIIKKNYKNTIDVSQLKSGIYYLELQDDNKKSIYKKFIKQ